MNIEKMREDFEAEWSKKTRWSDMQLRIFRHGEDYSDLATSAAWWGWQASRESLVIELPFAFKDCDSRDATDVREAIHAAGAKTK